MKNYRASAAGRLQAGVILVVLAIIFVYSSRKAWGLWRGLSAKPSDPQLFQLNLNTTVPAFLLTLVALGCLGVAWYLVNELLSQVQLDENGILLQAPGYRLFYRWDEIAALEVLQEADDDTTVCLKLTLVSDAPTDLSQDAPDEITAYLNELDQPADKAQRRRLRQARLQELLRQWVRVTRPDGRPVSPWLRLVYPQVRHPDCLLLYPALADRPALIAEVEQHLV